MSGPFTEDPGTRPALALRSDEHDVHGGTHPVCDVGWRLQHDWRQAGPEPVRRPGPYERCCWCGRPTTGIYVQPGPGNEPLLCPDGAGARGTPGATVRRHSDTMGDADT
jgi:hypothetical protein